jgi:hypothetical protein
MTSWHARNVPGACNTRAAECRKMGCYGLAHLANHSVPGLPPRSQPCGATRPRTDAPPLAASLRCPTTGKKSGISSRARHRYELHENRDHPELPVWKDALRAKRLRDIFDFLHRFRK